MTDHERAGPARLRRGTPADIEAWHALLWETVTDLGRRQATPLELDVPSPNAEAIRHLLDRGSGSTHGSTT